MTSTDRLSATSGVSIRQTYVWYGRFRDRDCIVVGGGAIRQIDDKPYRSSVVTILQSVTVFLRITLGKGVVVGWVGNGSNKTLHIQLLNTMSVQSFIPISCPVFVVHELKLNRKKKMMVNEEPFMQY